MLAVCLKINIVKVLPFLTFLHPTEIWFYIIGTGIVFIDLFILDCFIVFYSKFINKFVCLVLLFYSLIITLLFLIFSAVSAVAGGKALESTIMMMTTMMTITMMMRIMVMMFTQKSHSAIWVLQLKLRSYRQAKSSNFKLRKGVYPTN